MQLITTWVRILKNLSGLESCDLDHLLIVDPLAIDEVLMLARRVVLVVNLSWISFYNFS